MLSFLQWTLVGFITFVSSTALSQSDCMSHQDLKEIAKSFSQFDRFLGSKNQYCQSDMGREWFGVAKSLEVLKNLDPDEPQYVEDDAFTYKAIAENDWWSYFTKRAKTFTLQKRCQEGVVAYVMPFWGNGDINLCPLFFDQTITSQASVMMHEVRHFDGHRHVTCSQGNEKGNSGACDNEITGKGSYAISVQTLVGMARSQGVNPQEKPVVEAEAVYMAFNKFNRVPKVKLENSIILSSDQGEVVRWNLASGFETIGQLPEPSVVINSANNLTIYPNNTNSDAYRKDSQLMVKLNNPGLYAKHYNSETPQERAQYKAISYFAPGGLLKNNTLLTLCKSGSTDLGETNLESYGEFTTIISLSTDPKDQKREAMLLASSGDLYRFDCMGGSSNKVKIEKTQMNLKGAEKVLDSFGFDGKQYALLDDGKVAIMSIRGNSLELSPLNLPNNNANWVSASPISVPEVF